MKKLYTLLLPFIHISLFFSLNSKCQVPVLSWVKQIGGAAYDEGKSVVMDGSGNLYTTGHFTGTVDFDPGPGNSFLTSTAGNNYIAKFDASGSLIWAKQFGGTAESFAIKIDLSGNLYITGLFEGTGDFDPGVNVSNLVSQGAWDIFIIKLNNSGDLLWARSMGSATSYDSGSDIDVDASGNVYCTGFFSGTADFDPGGGTYNMTSAGFYDIFITKLDASGNLAWSKSIGSTLYDNGTSVKVDGSGNVYISGVYQGTADFDPGAGVFNLTNEGGSDAFILKMDGSGNFIWVKKIAGALSDAAKSLTIDGTGNIIVAGSFGGTVDFDPGINSTLLTSNGSADSYILKLDAAGNFIWARAFGGNLDDNAIMVRTDLSGNIYTTGQFAGTADFDPGVTSYVITSNGGIDNYFSKLDVSGNFKWALGMGGSVDDHSNAVAISANESVIYSTGYFQETADFDPSSSAMNLTSSGNEDIFLVKLSVNTLVCNGPTISSFSPAAGNVGSSVTITGTNFSSNANDNIIYFGPVKAAVTAASNTSITVTVPAGAKTELITVISSGLSAASLQKFVVTESSPASVTTNSFLLRVDNPTGNNPFSTTASDLDGDGKTDFIFTNYNDNTIAVTRNTTNTAIPTFASRLTLAVGTTPLYTAAGDLDGDGKNDIIVSNANSNTVSVFRNTSTPGSLSFAARIDISTGANPQRLTIADLDGDGKAEIIVANWNPATVSIHRNISSLGNVAFESPVALLTGSGPIGVAVEDNNGDNKADLAVTNYWSNTVSFYKNLSTCGTLTFATRIDYVTGVNPYYVRFVDVDGDGRDDLVTGNGNNNNGSVSVLLNTGSGSVISFAAKLDFETGLTPYNMIVEDVNGDGKPDLITANNAVPTVSVFQNTSSTGSVSFGTGISYSAGIYPSSVTTADVDNDNKMDIAVGNWGSGSFSILKFGKYYYRDADADGYGDPSNRIVAPAPFSGYVTDNTDCNDADALVHAPVTYYRDTDADGFGDAGTTTATCSSTAPTGYVANSSDCNDNDATINPNTVWYLDADNDGYYTGTGITSCTSPGLGYRNKGLIAANDCNDNDVAVHAQVTYYRDADADGFGNEKQSIILCAETPPAGYVATAGDCNDHDADTYPGAPELCDKKDNNCNGVADEGCLIIPDITISNAVVWESAGTVTLTVSLSEASNEDIKLSFQTVEGTAISKGKGKNPQIDFEAVKGSITIPAGSTEGSIGILVYQDALVEGDEDFTVELSIHNNVNATLVKAVGTVTITDATAALKYVKAKANPALRFAAKVLPNPSNSSFLINTISAGSAPVTITVTDILGRLIEKKMNIQVGTAVMVGDKYFPGVYTAEVQQGNERIVLKLIKQ